MGSPVIEHARVDICHAVWHSPVSPSITVVTPEATVISKPLHSLNLRMLLSIVLVPVPIAILTYTRINAKRDEIQHRIVGTGGKSAHTDEQVRAMRDRSAAFCYIL